jgi:hypothetical protein
LNPKILDWLDLQSGTIIIVPALNQTKQKLSLGFFYTGSQGNFSEILKNTPVVIKSNQVSPITLGFMSQFQFKNSGSVIPASIYFSKLTTSSVGGLDGENNLEIPIEIGGNIYYQYSFSSIPISPYIGFDFERFSTFNVSELQNGTPLSARQNSLLYTTFGMGYNFSIKSLRLHLKFSYSKTLSSSTNAANGDEAFTGTRRLIYLNIKQDGPFLMHIFYKHHDLNGATKLSIDRIGIGFGYFLY